jgi:hypothetical protein
MAIQTTSNLSPFHVQYHETYIREAMFNRLYDQFAMPFPGDMSALMSGSSVSYPFLSDMTPGVTAISQTADVTPQTLVDATASITPTSRGEALQWSELLGDIQQSYNYNEERAMKLGLNQAESVDLLAQAAALKGTFLYSAAARASLDAGTSSHRASDALFGRMQGYLQNLRVPAFITPDGGSQVWMALMHPFPFHDIRESGNVDSIGLYQDQGIHLNFELGKIGPFRMVVNAWAKVFFAAGANNATAVGTTIAAGTSTENGQLDTAIEVAANTNITAGDWLLIGDIETGSTHYPENEYVFVTATPSGTTVSILGQGPNGGLRFTHAVGKTVSNADNVYPIVFGGPFSLVKLYAPSIGEFGQLVPEERTGLLKQFIQSGWKWYGGYSRLVDNRVLRVEVSSSYEA